jgi:hypothetical protein
MHQTSKENSIPLVDKPLDVKCYRNIPLQTGELSLGLLTPIPRQKVSFGHYHSYKFIFSIEKERRRGSVMYLIYDSLS